MLMLIPIAFVLLFFIYLGGREDGRREKADREFRAMLAKRSMPRHYTITKDVK